MKTGTPKPAEELRMSGAKFDRIMERVLRVKPQAKKAKRSAKAQSSRKKASAGK